MEAAEAVEAVEAAGVVGAAEAKNCILSNVIPDPKGWCTTQYSTSGCCIR